MIVTWYVLGIILIMCYAYLCSTGVLVEGNVFLQDYGYLRFDLWYNEAALLLMATLLLTLAYVNLRLINKRK